MKKLVVVLFFVSVTCLAGNRYPIVLQDEPVRLENVPLLLPGIFAFIEGNVTVRNDTFYFQPRSDCYSLAISRLLLGCKGELFKDLVIPFANIEAIKRRNYLLIAPNKFLILTKDGRKYKFGTYRREKVIRAFKTYQQSK